MPALDWVGKDKVVNHHLDVPYKPLEHVYGFNNGLKVTTKVNSGNKIIHGDNLEALKSLMPEYEGKVKCIYVDPPYNTGNQSWVYNDNVNSPTIQGWLGTVVGKPKDITRHDKWLCMMYPRLKLLYKMLSHNGTLWISIGDSEAHNLKHILIEIFGENNFIAQVVRQTRCAPSFQVKLGAGHDYILVFAKNKDTFNKCCNMLPIPKTRRNHFKNPNNDPRGDWVPDSFTAQHAHKNLTYPIISPAGIKHIPPKGIGWTMVESKYKKLLADNRMWFGKDGKGVPARKSFLSEHKGTSPWTWWTFQEVGYNALGTIELHNLFNDRAIFPYPKPVKLISRILQLYTNPNDGDIVLDSFAGSGTTAHAVLKANVEDGGNRKFVLVEMEDYADRITAERVKRVNGGNSTFDFYKLDVKIPLKEDRKQGFLNVDMSF